MIYEPNSTDPNKQKYFNSPNEKYIEGHPRYIHIVGNLSKPLIVIGYNPSTADQDQLDDTLKYINTVINNKHNKKHAFSGFIMLNLYPERHTKPTDMPKKENEAYHWANMSMIETVFRFTSAIYGDSPIPVWCAWGADVKYKKKSYTTEAVEFIYKVTKNYNCQFFKYIKPHMTSVHPPHLQRAMQPYESIKLVKFDFDNYIKAVYTKKKAKKSSQQPNSL